MSRILKVMRCLLAAVTLLGVLGVFLFPAYAVRFGLLTRLQLVPAVMAGAVVELAFLLALAAFFGRLYCAVLCPLGIFQDLFRFCFAWVPAIPWMRSRRVRLLAEGLRWLVLAVFLVSLVLGAASILDPYGIFGRFVSAGVLRAGEPDVVVVGWALGLMAVILLMTFFGARTWCNLVCPVGTFLGLIARISVFRPRIDKATCIACGACARRCDKGAITADDARAVTVDPSRCVMCGKCLGACTKNALRFRRNP